MTTRVPAEVFPPGDFIQEELEERGWTQGDLAEIIGRSRRLVTELVNAKRGVTPETARALADAFDTSAEFWLNLETAFRLSRVGAPNDEIARKARIYSIGPIKNMARRGWIDSTGNVDLLESQIIRFFDLPDIDEDPKLFKHAARKSTSYTHITNQQLAWLYRAKDLAQTLKPDLFRRERFDETIARLKENLQHVQQVDNVSEILSDGGIRFLIVEHLPDTKIDGACFWLDDNSPVVTLSMRYDRIDYFWHTLMHELGHVQNGGHDDSERISLDVNIFASDRDGYGQKPDHETAADKFAVNALVSQSAIQKFVEKFGPYYSKQRILTFAEQCNVHPAIVVGQLQHSGKITYSKFRGMLEPVRDVITTKTLADGWGHRASIA